MDRQFPANTGLVDGELRLLVRSLSVQHNFRLFKVSTRIWEQRQLCLTLEMRCRGRLPGATVARTFVNQHQT
jgi:hypothetical protein